MQLILCNYQGGNSQIDGLVQLYQYDTEHDYLANFQWNFIYISSMVYCKVPV